MRCFQAWSYFAITVPWNSANTGNTTAGCFFFFRPRHCNVLSAAKYELKLLAECQWKGLALDGLKMWPLQLTSVNRQIILPVIPIWPEFSVSGRSYRRGLEPPTVLFKVKNWRENWASMLAPTMREERVLIFFFLSTISGGNPSQWQMAAGWDSETTWGELGRRARKRQLSSAELVCTG